MDDEHQSAAYAKADFSWSNQWFVDMLGREFPDYMKKVIDLGCGPGDVPVRLARASQRVHITAVDGSGPMIRLTREAVSAAGLVGRIEAVEGYIPGLNLAEHSFDAVLCKDMIHHLPDPSVLWSEARRLGRAGAAICVMDLYRPESREIAAQIVENVSGGEDPVLKRDFFDSLCAAFTVEEIAEQLERAGLDLLVETISERHMVIKGYLP